MIGNIQDRILYKEVWSSKGHFCWKYDGWGIDYDAFINQIKPSADQIRIRDNDTKVVYFTSVENFETNGIIDVLREIDGKQIFLPIKFFNKEDKNQPSLL